MNAPRPWYCAICGHHVKKHGGTKCDPGAPCSVYTGLKWGMGKRCGCTRFVPEGASEAGARP